MYNAGGDSKDTDAALGSPMDLSTLERIGVRFEGTAGRGFHRITNRLFGPITLTVYSLTFRKTDTFFTFFSSSQRATKARSGKTRHGWTN